MMWRERINYWLTGQMLLVTLVYLIFIGLVKVSNSRRYNDWDAETTTIADYTLRYEIPRVVYDKYKE